MTVTPITLKDLHSHSGYTLHMTYPSGVTHSGLIGNVSLHQTFQAGTKFGKVQQTYYKFYLGDLEYTISDQNEGQLKLSVEAPKQELPTEDYSMIYVLKAELEMTKSQWKEPVNQPYILDGGIWYPVVPKYWALRPQEILDFEVTGLKPQIRKAH